MSLVSWQDITDRYPKVADRGGATQIGSSYIDYAEAALNSQLGAHFAVPFSSDNLTAKDLVIDMVYARTYQFRDAKILKTIQDDIQGRIDALRNGKAAMYTATSSDLLYASNVGGAVYSSTSGYEPVFGMIPEIDQVVDPDLLQDEYSDRDMY